MQTDENEDDEEIEEHAPEQGDDVASIEEVNAAIDDFYANKSTLKRVTAIAALILQGKPQLRRQFAAEDLLQEALERISVQRRRWPKNRVDFQGFAIGVMRSWSSSLEKKFSRTDVGVVMEHELAPAAEDAEGLNLEDIAGDSDTPEELLLQGEDEAEGKSYLAILQAQLDPADLSTKIVDEILKNSRFETHEEICSALGVPMKDYRNAWKVLMRAGAKLKPKE